MHGHRPSRVLINRQDIQAPSPFLLRTMPAKEVGTSCMYASSSNKAKQIKLSHYSLSPHVPAGSLTLSFRCSIAWLCTQFRSYVTCRTCPRATIPTIRSKEALSHIQKIRWRHNSKELTFVPIFYRALDKQPLCRMPHKKHQASKIHSAKNMFAECQKKNTRQRIL